MSTPRTDASHPTKTAFRTLLSQNKFLFIVYYRGSWCPFCMSYVRTLASYTPQITAAGGTPVIITAEAAGSLPKTRAATGYNGEAISDPDHAIAGELKGRFELDVAISDKGGYPYGMAQPAVLVLKNDGTVVYKWAIVPKLTNLGGATDRPVLDEVIVKALSEIKGTPMIDCKPKATGRTSVAGLLREKIFGKSAPAEC